jgi:predicted component of viral defense system (DUF524 family)
MATTIHARAFPTKIKQPKKKDKGKMVVKVQEITFDTENIWRKTFQSSKGIDFDDLIIQEKLANITSKIAKKIKQSEKKTRKEMAIMKKILSSSVGPVMKEAME